MQLGFGDILSTVQCVYRNGHGSQKSGGCYRYGIILLNFYIVLTYTILHIHPAPNSDLCLNYVQSSSGFIWSIHVQYFLLNLCFCIMFCFNSDRLVMDHSSFQLKHKVQGLAKVTVIHKRSNNASKAENGNGVLFQVIRYCFKVHVSYIPSSYITV